MKLASDIFQLFNRTTNIYQTIVIAFLWFIIGSDSAHARVVAPIQDSVKKVTIKVTASEKRPALNFDSLYRSSEAKAKTSIRSRKKREIVASPAVRQPDKSIKVDEQTPSLPSKSRVAVAPRVSTPSTASKSDANVQAAPVDDHHDDGELVQAVEEDVEAGPQHLKTSRTYLWVGFMLIVIGAILGILFGKTALLVSIAGMVFVIIGYTI